MIQATGLFGVRVVLRDDVIEVFQAGLSAVRAHVDDVTAVRLDGEQQPAARALVDALEDRLAGRHGRELSGRS